MDSPQSDQARWFSEEVQAHDPVLRSYLRGAFPAVRDVDDLVQESYLRMWRRQTAKPIQSVRAFLFKVARHLALDTVRRDSRSPFDPVSDLVALRIAEERPGTAEEACQREEFSLLLEAIDTLPARTREVYLLRKFEGLSQKEVAAQLGISENTVEVQIGRANRRCEAFLRRRGVIGHSLP